MRSIRHLRGVSGVSGGLAALTCREVLDFLDDYVEGTLTGNRRLLFGRHLAACEACRAYLSQYVDTIRLGRRAYSPTLAGPPEALIRAILRARRAL